MIFHFHVNFLSIFMILYCRNTREIMFGILYPSRQRQLEYSRYFFMGSYALVSILLSVVLVKVSDNQERWAGNSVIDAILLVLFWIYCSKVHVHNPGITPTCFAYPKLHGFFEFPRKLGAVFGVLMFISLLGIRVPSLFFNFSNMSAAQYASAMLYVVLASVPIALYSNFWSLAAMLFRPEFTASPGNYNSIHDPIIRMVAAATATEGVLDVLSCVVLMALASYKLPKAVNVTIAIFCMLELINACQV